MDSEVFNDFRMIARRLLGDTDGNTALAQWLDWKDRKGKAAPMCTTAAFDFAKEHSAVRFWKMEGNAVPELQRLALIVLPQPISVGAVERVWSTYGWIQSKLRNRLVTARKGAEACDGSLPFAHAAHAKGGQMGGGPPGVARGG